MPHRVFARLKPNVGSETADRNITAAFIGKSLKQHGTIINLIILSLLFTCFNTILAVDFSLAAICYILKAFYYSIQYLTFCLNYVNSVP